MSSSSKRYVAAVAALQILLYHCWIPVFKFGTAIGSIERFLISSTYSGVDIFFFISAYSLATRPVSDYGKFILNRAIKILPYFLIAYLLGHFIWFLPAIMIMYLLFPPMYKLCSKSPLIALPLLLLGWAGITYLILGVLKPSQDIGIFLFRIPAIILGAYAGGMIGQRSDASAPMGGETIGQKASAKAPMGAGLTERAKQIIKMISGVILLGLGIVLVYKYGYIDKLNTPFRGTFYLMGIPVMLGTILITDCFAVRMQKQGATFWDGLIKGFGSITLELYFVQMVLGTVLINLIYKFVGIKLVTNILVMGIIICISLLLNAVSKRIIK